MIIFKGFELSGRGVFSLLLGPVLFLTLYNMAPPAGMTPEAQAVLASTVWVAVWWITEAIPIPVTALLPIVILPLTGALSLNDTTAAYGNPIIFLFLGGFLIALAMEKWDLHKRIALNIILSIGTNQVKIILGFMVATTFLSMWISNTATAMMMLPIGIAVITQFSKFNMQDKLEKEDMFSKALMLGIAYAASIGGLATIVGTPANAILVAVAGQSLNMKVSFYFWMMIGLPLTIVLLIICWLYLVKVAFPLKAADGDNKNGNQVIAAQLKELGKISREEKWVLAIFIFTALSWISRAFFLNKFLPHLDDSMIAVFSAILLFLIPASSRSNKERILDWKVAEKLPWGILLLFGGGLAIASGFTESGLAAWIGNQMTLLENVPVFIIIICIVAIVNFLTEVTSNTATATMLLPIMAALGLAVNIPPFSLMVAACLASSCAFMLPVATPPNAIVFGSGFLKIEDMVKAGFALNIITIIIISLYIYTFSAFWI